MTKGHDKGHKGQMSNREAMKLALEALEVATTPLAKDRQEVIAAQKALRQAIQEAALQRLTDIHQEMEQKPVAWWNPDESGLAFQKLRGDWQPLYAAPVHTIDINQKRVDETAKDKHEPDAYGDGKVYRGQRSKDSTTKTLHYTAPPKREWVGLTDEEVSQIENEYTAYRQIPEGSVREFARAIEAKLKEKNS